MDCQYEMIVTEEQDALGRAYTGYGVEAWRQCGAERVLLYRVPDLFMCRERCKAFVQMCNEEEVASFHLLEVIDNLLGK